MRFGPSEQQVVVFTESSAYAVRQREAAWDARPLHIDVLLKLSS